MSDALVAAGFWLDLPPARKMVLLALCQRADLKTGVCFPGLNEISLRASLSAKSTIGHLQALERDGWVKRSSYRPRRAGETVRRWINVSRVLTEGEARRDAFRSDRHVESSSGAEFDPSQLNLEPELGEVDADPLEVDADPLEAASRGIVNTEQSQETSENSHITRARDAAAPVDGDARLDVGAPDKEQQFATLLLRQLNNKQLTELRVADAEIDTSGDRVVLSVHGRAALGAEIAKKLTRAARGAGFKGIDVRDLDEQRAS